MSPDRKVKGSVVQDLVKVVRAFRSAPWEQYLSAEELRVIDAMILPTEWYPLEFYQRVGIAVFKLAAQGDLEAVRAFGRTAMRELLEGPYRRFLLAGDPFTAVQKFLDLRKTLFNFSTMTLIPTGEKSLTVRISELGLLGEGVDLFTVLLAVHLQVIVEANGAQNVTAASRHWTAAGDTILEVDLAWS